MKNLLVLGLYLIIFICAGCAKKEETMSHDMKNMPMKDMKMPMDKDKTNE